MKDGMTIKTDTEALAIIPPQKVSMSDDVEWKEQEEIPEEPTNRMLIELGMETLTLKKIKGYKKIAKVLKSVGMVEYERGCLMHREQSLAASIIAVTQLVLHDGDKGTKIAAAMALKELVAAANKTAELNIRLEELAREKAKETPVSSGLPPMYQRSI
jgi:hypothetical protein